MAAQLSPAQLQALMARLNHQGGTASSPPSLDAALKLSPDQLGSAQGSSAVAQLVQALSQGFDPSPEQRRKLVSAILPAASFALDHAAPPPHLLHLCTLLKLVGRSPAGTEELARTDGLAALVRLGGLARAADLPPAGEGDSAPTPSSTRDDEQDDDDDPAAKAARALSSLEEDPLSPPEQEALRCLANTLTLHPSAREVFPDVLLAETDQHAALRGLVRLLGCKGAGFLAGRLLFLLTSRPSELVGELALEGECVLVMQQFAERYLAIYHSESHRPSLTAGTPSLDDILREHLKLAYNLMLQYSRAPPVVPEGFDKPSPSAGASAGAAASGKKRFRRPREKSGASNSSSPDLGAADDASDAGSAAAAAAASAPGAKSPRSLAQKVVDAVKGSTSTPGASSPVGSPSLGASKELGTQPAGSSSAAPAEPSKAAATEGGSSDSLSLTAAQLFLPLFRPYLILAVTLPPAVTSSSPASSSSSATSPQPIKDPSPVVRAALNTLLNFPVELEELSGWSTSWLQYVPSRISPDDGTVLRGGGIGSLGERLVELLHGVCEAYFPADRAPPSPKAYSARDRDEPRTLVPPCGPDEWIPSGEGEAAKVDEILGPVMLLLRKLSMLGEAQFVFRNVLFPPDLDRSTPIDRHPSLAGHLVRLLSSILLPNTSFGVGEFLYNLCDRSPEQLSRTIGYGNASGFLQSRGELIPPPPHEDDGGQKGPRINPITGAFDSPSSAAAADDDDEPPMSEEDKEREAERLYTLFERLQRTGVISTPANPVEQARAQGRFEETSEEREAERERVEREERELEQEVERDLREWKERRARRVES
ncbi:hypothetical protein JCM3775_005585 [Rhodotorula graminis]